MLKKVLPRCGLAALLAALSAPSYAYVQLEYGSYTPWKYQELSAEKFGGDWNTVSDIYIADIDGNGSADLIRQNNSDENALVIHLNLTSTTPVGEQNGLDPELDWYKLRADSPGFAKTFYGESYWLFHGEHTKLFLGQFNDGGDDILRQESTTKWAKDEFNSAEIFSVNIDEDGYLMSKTQTLGDAYNGLDGDNELSLADFNGDGLTDVLIRDKGPSKEEDGTYNALVTFSVTGSGDQSNA